MKEFLVLSKRQPRPNEGGEVLVPAGGVIAVEPHREGSFVYVPGHRFDVSHSHVEIVEAISAVKRVGR